MGMPNKRASSLETTLPTQLGYRVKERQDNEKDAAHLHQCFIFEMKELLQRPDKLRKTKKHFKNGVKGGCDVILQVPEPMKSSTVSVQNTGKAGRNLFSTKRNILFILLSPSHCKSAVFFVNLF